MIRYARRIFLDDFRSWLPAIITVMLVTALTGVTAGQFAWTHNPVFVNAVSEAGHDIAEFRIVSETIYMVVAPLAILSLTIVGNATVDATRPTFAKWRLIGASPSEIRRSIWVLVAMAAGIGATAGSLLAIPASYALIPTFNQMAVPGFTAPVFRPTPLAWLLALGLGFFTCLAGAFVPSLRAAKVGPVEAMRSTARTGPRLWWRISLGALGLASAIALAVMGGHLDAIGHGGDLDVGLSVVVNLALNAGMMAVLAAYLLAGPSSALLLRVFARLSTRAGVTTAATAARAAHERAATSTNTLAPLTAGIGGTGVMIAAIQTGVGVIGIAGSGATNLTDTLVLVGIISFVCLITSTAALSLSGRGTNHEIALLRAAGMSRRTVHKWFGWQALALALTAVLLAVVPVALAITTGVLGSRALVGHAVLVVPWLVLVTGLVASAAVIYLVFSLPARSSLRASIATSLRESTV